MTTTKINDENLFDMLLHPDALHTPQPYYDLIHKHAPVALTQAGFYLISRYADVSHVLRDNATFRSPGPQALVDMAPRINDHPALAMISRSILALDGKRHAHIRNLSAREFTPRRIAALTRFAEERCAQKIAGLKEKIEGGAVVDLMAELAVPFPLEFLAELVGIPTQDRDHLADVIHKVLHIIEPDPSEERLREADAAYLEIDAYLRQLIRDRRSHPREDFVTAVIAAAHASTESYSDDDLVVSLVVVWAAGFDASAAAIGNGIALMLQDDQLRRELAECDDAALRRHVDEIFRLECPVQIPPAIRFTTRNVVIADTPIPAGSEVRVLLSAANRDRSVFDAPDSFRAHREGPAVLTFSAGIHYCLGAGLAKVELATVLRRYATTLGHSTLTHEPTRYKSLLLRTFSKLNVHIT